MIDALIDILAKRSMRQPDADTKVFLPPFAPDDHTNTVYIDLDGVHGTFINRISRKDYFIVSGKITFSLDGKTTDAVQGDIVSVPANVKHSMEGVGCFFCSCTPPYAPENEDIL